MNDNLGELESKRIGAAWALQKALERRWPVGTNVGVILNSRQREPSRAEVINHSGSFGTVRVRLIKPDRRGRRHVANVRWCHIE